MGRVSDARDRLIEAAIDLIYKHGYAGVSVDHLCEAAGVKKGSFYHFFKTKDELVLAALDTHWERRRPILDRLFSPTVAPLERLRAYFDSVYARQLELKARYGQFGGCFYSAVGMTSHDSPAIGERVRAILARYERYYESALREAALDGILRSQDVAPKARSLFAYMEGVLQQARLNDDPAIVKALGKSAFAFLGIQGESRVRESRSKRKRAANS